MRVCEPLVNTNLSEVRSSVVPSSSIKVYLSSSKGKNVKSAPAAIAPVELVVIVTSYCFLILKFDSVKSTLAINCFGNGVQSIISRRLKTCSQYSKV